MASHGAATASSRARARVLLFGAGLLFGLAAVLARLATAGGMSGGQATFARFVVGLVAISLVFLARPGAFRARNLPLLAARGLFGGLAALLYFQAIARIPAGEATLLNNTFPIWAVIISFAVLGERPTIHLALALAVASAGVFLALGGGRLPRALGAGELLAIASAVLAGAAVTTIRALRADHGSPIVFFAFTLGSLLVSAPSALAPWPTAPLPWVAAAGVGVVAFLAQLSMTEAYGALSVAEAAIWQQLTPLASFVLALTIGERLTPVALVGVLIGVSGVAYGALLGHRPRAGSPPALREAAAGLPAEEP